MSEGEKALPDLDLTRDGFWRSFLAFALMLPATVALIEYQGSYVQLRLAHPATGELQVVLDEAAFDASPVATGEQVALSWPRAEARPLAA